MLKKFNYRQTSLCGCFLVCSGIIITSFTNSYGQLIVPVCIIIGAGQSILMPSTALAINTYFKKRLTLAMSLTITAVGILPIMVPQICDYLLNSYGRSSTVLLFGGIALHSFIGALLLRPLKIQKRITANEVGNQSEKLLPEPSTPNTRIDKDDGGIFKRLLVIFDLELFRQRAYLIIIIGMSISYVSELNFTLMAPFVLSELAGFTRKEVALAMSVQAAADIFGRLVIPIIFQKVGCSSKIMYAYTLGGFSIGRTVMASFCDIKYVVFASCVVIGLSKGAKAVFQSLILPKYVSLDKLPSAMGFLMVLNGALSLIIGPLIGAVHDLTKSYTYALHAATFLSTFCILLWVVDYYQRRCRPTHAVTETQNDNVM